MMKRSISLLLAALMASALLSGCADGGAKLAPPAPVPPAPQASAPGDAGWSGYSATLTRRESGQYSNAVLKVKWLEAGAALFGLDLTEGSESGENPDSLQISGTMYLEDEKTGVYEDLQEDGGAAYSIRFLLSQDGRQITVSHDGDMAVNPDGDYDCVDAGVTAGLGLAAALLESLPAAATSLNRNLGAYTFQASEESAPEGFYPVTATLDGTGAVLASFALTEDLTAVWRLDTEDGVPILIFGKAQAAPEHSACVSQ